MVLTLDGSLEIGAHSCIEIGNLICLRHLLRARAVANLKYIPFPLPSNISTLAQYTLVLLFITLFNTNTIQNEAKGTHIDKIQCA